ncbi:uncharacterized protein LOC108938962 [Scleropages formosus]|uniref:uncharacterized protein LOC108938962 n=1 Tax=Scleropages formosus TaxID=113540 RepID=UPI0010FA7A77|nr:uncharacterized protein LOC108938962 [Scleropages formosus]
MSFSSAFYVVFGFRLLILVDEATLNETKIFCVACKEEGCPEKLTKIYNTSENTPFWVNESEIQSCADTSLKVYTPCVHNLTVFLPTENNADKFHFEGGGIPLKSDYEPCPPLPQEGDISSKQSGTQNASESINYHFGLVIALISCVAVAVITCIYFWIRLPGFSKNFPRAAQLGPGKDKEDSAATAILRFWAGIQRASGATLNLRKTRIKYFGPWKSKQDAAGSLSLCKGPLKVLGPTCTGTETLRLVSCYCGHARAVWSQVESLCKSLHGKTELAFDEIMKGWTPKGKSAVFFRTLAL